tara:strand:+ start:76 stop:630 length:555 start_codon:yes stop_codon:yes gene_type:complete
MNLTKENLRMLILEVLDEMNMGNLFSRRIQKEKEIGDYSPEQTEEIDSEVIRVSDDENRIRDIIRRISINPDSKSDKDPEGRKYSQITRDVTKKADYLKSNMDAALLSFIKAKKEKDLRKKREREDKIAMLRSKNFDSVESTGVLDDYMPDYDEIQSNKTFPTFKGSEKTIELREFLIRVYEGA